MSDLNIAMILRLVDQVTGPSRRVLSSMREVGGAVDNAGRGMLGAADRIGAASQRQMGIIQGQTVGLVAFGAAAYGLLRPAVEFEAAMDKVGAVARASGFDLDRMTATARELGATTPWAASQAAEGMQFLAMAGFEVNDVVAAMPGMLDLASAGATDLGTAADIASNILTGFGLEAAEMGRVGDILTNTFTSTNTNLRTLGETMKYVAPAAAAVGLSLEEAAAMAGALGGAGIQGSMAGTGLRAMISRLAAPADGALDALEQLEIKTADADGNMRPMIDILAEMDGALKLLGTAEQASLRKAIFGEEASAAAQVLMIQAGSGALREFAIEVQEQGSAARVAQEQNDNMSGSLKAIQSATQAVSITIGNVFLPALVDMTATLIPMLQQINAWADLNPELIKALGQLALWMVGLKVASLGLRLAFILLASPVATVLRTLGWLLVLVARLNPWVLIATSVALAAKVIRDNWDNIGAYFSDKFDRIKAAFDVGWVQGVLTLLQETSILDIMEDAMAGLVGYFGEEVKSWLAAIDDGFSGFSLYDSGKAMIQTLWSGAKGVIPRMVEDIKARIAGILPDWLSPYLSGGGGDSAAPDAAVDMTGPLRPPRADGTYTQNNTITITPHPNQNPEAIANEVIRQQALWGRGGPAMPHLYDTPEDAQ